MGYHGLCTVLLLFSQNHFHRTAELAQNTRTFSMSDLFDKNSCLFRSLLSCIAYLTKK